jgi:DNA-binding MarR family transcriptional regulator
MTAPLSQYDVDQVRHMLETAKEGTQMLIDYYGGDITLNQTLVYLNIYLYFHDGYDPSISDLVKATGLPHSTVSRAITARQEAGTVTNRPDPNDGRKRRYFLRNTEKRLINLRRRFLLRWWRRNTDKPCCTSSPVPIRSGPNRSGPNGSFCESCP